MIQFPSADRDASLFDDLSLKVSPQFKADCELAKVETTDASGRVVDVHCVRYYFGTELARAGAPLHVVACCSETDAAFHTDINKRGLYPCNT